MFHWCYQETDAVVASVPFIGYYLRKAYVWCHTWYHGKKHHHDDCVSRHLPVEEWDPISILDVEDRFGIEVIDDLIGDPQLLGMFEAPPEGEFTWLVNQNGALMAHFHNRTFLYYGKDASYDAWVELAGGEET